MLETRCRICKSGTAGTCTGDVHAWNPVQLRIGDPMPAATMRELCERTNNLFVRVLGINWPNVYVPITAKAATEVMVWFNISELSLTQAQAIDNVTLEHTGYELYIG